MKYAAHISRNVSSPIVSVIEAQRLREQNPARWEGKTYFSLWHLTPMCLRINSNGTAFFAFLPGTRPHPCETGGGESYAHELAKHIIRNLCRIALKTGAGNNRITDTLLFEEQPQLEYRYDQGLYITDIRAVVKNPNLFLLEPGTPLAIEIFHTHKTDLAKRKYYRTQHIAAIELRLPENISEELSFQRLQRRLQGWFDAPRYFTWLHDPAWRHKWILHKPDPCT